MPRYIKTNMQITDMFTKALQSRQFHFLLGSMSLWNIHIHFEGEYQEIDRRKKNIIHLTKELEDDGVNKNLEEVKI